MTVLVVKMQDTQLIKDFPNIFGKTKCVHPGKDPKCDDCPDIKKNAAVSSYMPSNKELTQSL